LQFASEVVREPPGRVEPATVLSASDPA
jgi:hypothetical protein